MKRIARLLAVILSLALLIPNGAMAATKENFSDFPNNWSSAALSWAVEEGLIQGYGGEIRPADTLSRSQMAAILNRAFGSTATASLEGYTDVPEGTWYHDDMAKAVRMEVLSGDGGGHLSPQAPITREQAFTVLRRAYALEEGDASVLNRFSDASSVSNWAKPELAALVQAGYVQGSGGKLNPKATISRAEFAQVASNMIDSFVTEANADGTVIDGNAVVREPGLSLNGMVIKGDLILADGVDAASVDLTGVTIEGRLVIRGGSQDVNVTNSSAAGGVVVKSPNDPVRLVTADSDLGEVRVDSDLIVHGDLSALAIAEDVTVTIESGTVAKVTVDEDITDARLIVKSGAAVSAVEGNEDGIKISGDGTLPEEGQPETPAGPSTPSTPSAPATPTPAPETAGMIQTARAVDLGWSQFVAVRFAEGYSLDNTALTVDGTDVTAAFTKVTTDGSIVKWEVTSWDPAKLTATSGGKTQTVALTENADPTAPAVRRDTTAGYMTAHGPMLLWDYYLTNYDQHGNLRVHPAATTFDLSGKAETDAPAFYSPVAEMDDSGIGNDVEILFNQRDDGEKAWFAAIPASGGIELVTYNENQWVSNARLTYTLDASVPHGSSTVAEVKIPLNGQQSNLRTSGRYYVRVRSEGHSTVLAPIHIVNSTAPTLTVTAGSEIRSGENVMFEIGNMTYGITNPTYAAELTYHGNSVSNKGTTTQLTMIDDWYQIGNYLFLYNTEDSDGVDRNKIARPGWYTLKVYSNGFKDMAASFFVSVGADGSTMAQGNSRSLRTKLSVDSVSSASAGISTGSDGSGGSGQEVSADVLFDADLLINAKLLNKLGLGNEATQGIDDRWEEMITSTDSDRVSARGTRLGGFVWSDYYAAVTAARAKGSYLCFADYAAAHADEEYATVPHTVKEVLEDNLLGDIQYNAGWVGESVPAMRLVETQSVAGGVEFTEISKVTEGGKIHLLTEDPAYFNALTEVTVNGYTAEALRKDDGFTVQQYQSNGTAVSVLTIDPAVSSANRSNRFLFGTNILELTAAGYKDARIGLRYERDLEDVTAVTADKESYQRREKVRLTAVGSQGDFYGNLTNDSVLVYAPESNEAKRVLSASQGGTSGVYWMLNEDKTVLTVVDLKGELLAANGEYTITITPAHYGTFTVRITVEGDLLAVPNPTPTGTRETDADNNAKTYYKLDFGTETSVSAWKAKISGVTVNGTAYSPAASYLSLAAKEYDWPTTVQGEIVLRLYGSTIFTSGENTVVISATGYEDLELTLDGVDGTLTSATKPAPEIAAIQSQGDGVYQVNFSTESAILSRWLEKVTAGGEVAAKGTDTIDVKLALGFGTVTVQAEGYEDLAVEIRRAPIPGTATLTYATASGYGDYWTIPLNDSAYAQNITSITAGGKTYTALASGYYLPDSAAYKFLRDSGKVLLSADEDGIASFGAKTQVTIRANGYADNSFEVDRTGVSPVAAPEKDTISTVYATPNYYRVSFTGETAAVQAYVEKISSVAVGSKAYAKVTSLTAKEQYRLSADPNSFSLSPVLLDISAAGISEKVTVTVKAKGYADQSFDIDPAGYALSEAPELQSAVVKYSANSASYDVVEVTFKGDSSYTGAITGVKLGSTALDIDQGYGTTPATGFYKISGGKLTLNPTDVTLGATQLTVTANGYKEKAYTFPAEQDFTLAAAVGERASNQYTVTLTGINVDESTFSESQLIGWLRGATVQVGGTSYTYNSYLGSTASWTLAKRSADNAVYGLTFTADGVDTYMADKTDAGTYSVPVSITPAAAHGGPAKVEAAISVVVEDPADPEKVLPTVAGTEKTTPSYSSYAPYYTVTFSGLDSTALDTYLRAVTAVKVGSTSYSEMEGSGSTYSTFYTASHTYRWNVLTSGGSASGTLAILRLTADGIPDFDAATTVVVTAAGYDDLTFTIDNNKAAPAMTLEEDLDAGTFVLTSTDANWTTYLGKVSGVTVNGNTYSACTSSYSLDKTKDQYYIYSSNGTFTLMPSRINGEGENTVAVQAVGYATQTVTGDFTNKADSYPAAPTRKAVSFQFGSTAAQDYYLVTFDGDDTTVHNYLNRITSTKIGDTEITVDYASEYNYSYGGYINTGLKVYAKDVSGETTVSILSRGFKPGSVTITPVAKTAPSASAVEKVTPSYSYYSPYYRVTLTGADESALKGYLRDLTSVTVGDKEFSKSSYSFYSSDTAKWKQATDTATSTVLGIDLTVDAISDSDGDTVITLVSSGYDDLVITVTRSGDALSVSSETKTHVEPDPGEGKAAPTTVPTAQYNSTYQYYELTYGSGYDTAALAWLSKITSIKVGETAYTKASSYPSTNQYYVGSSTSVLWLNRAGLGGYPSDGTDTSYTVVISAEGYKDLTMIIRIQGDYYSGPTATVTSVS